MFRSHFSTSLRGFFETTFIILNAHPRETQRLSCHLKFAFNLAETFFGNLECFSCFLQLSFDCLQTLFQAFHSLIKRGYAFLRSVPRHQLSLWAKIEKTSSNQRSSQSSNTLSQNID